MSDRAKTRNRVLIIVAIVALACVLLTAGAVAAGGVVYALTRGTDWLGQLSEEIPLTLPSQRTAEDERTIVSAADDDERGIVLAAVVEDSPAAQSGVKRGDILLEFDGDAVDSYAELRQALEAVEPGDEVELRLLHGDDERRLTATLDERDSEAFLGVVPCCAIREGDVENDVRIEPLERLPAGGALIIDVVEDSPAANAGLEAGDIVLAVDGQELGDELSLSDAIRAHQPGDRATLALSSQAGDEERELTVELGEHPDEEGVAYLGVTYQPADMRGFRRFRVPLPDDSEGSRPLPPAERFRYVIPQGLARVVVVDVEADSPAEGAGLREGDVILSIDDEPIQTPRDVVSAVTAREPEDELMLTVRRPGEEDDADQELELSVILGEHPDDGDRAYLGVRLGLSAELELEGWRPQFDLPEEWHWEFRLPEDWELPFDLDELPDEFKFDWPPGDDGDGQETLTG